MALQQVSLNSGLVDGGSDGRQPSGDEGNKTSRLPRWTKQDILVLIQGKAVAENRLRRVRASSGLGQVEPKWESVSSYCKDHGVNRGPIQCRKRWSNLAGDFKRIKEWESNLVGKETDSFWVMRNDVRRERKLPGFFDRDVFDILDGGVEGGADGDAETGEGLSLSLAPTQAAAEDGGEEEGPEVLFDSGRTNDGLFSDFDQEVQIKETPVSEQQHEAFLTESPCQDRNREKQPGPDTGESKKRKRSASVDVAGNLENQLIETLNKNSKLLSSQLESLNTDVQLDREQRKDHANSLITALNRLADALGRIADKL